MSVSNADGVFLEKDHSNNSAWQAFTVTRDSNGNPKIKLTSHSPCTEGTGLCGERTANR